MRVAFAQCKDKLQARRINREHSSTRGNPIAYSASFVDSASVGLKPQSIDDEDLHATHTRSVEDARQFQARSNFDASDGCMRNTGPNYHCSDDGKYIVAVNMPLGDDLLEVTVNEQDI